MLQRGNESAGIKIIRVNPILLPVIQSQRTARFGGYAAAHGQCLQTARGHGPSIPAKGETGFCLAHTMQVGFISQEAIIIIYLLNIRLHQLPDDRDFFRMIGIVESAGNEEILIAARGNFRQGPGYSEQLWKSVNAPATVHSGQLVLLETRCDQGIKFGKHFAQHLDVDVDILSGGKGGAGRVSKVQGEEVPFRHVGKIKIGRGGCTKFIRQGIKRLFRWCEIQDPAVFFIQSVVRDTDPGELEFFVLKKLGTPRRLDGHLNLAAGDQAGQIGCMLAWNFAEDG